MTNTSIGAASGNGDALAWPFDEGIGGGDSENAWRSAGKDASGWQYVGSKGYVHSGLDFTGHDGAADQVDLAAGRAYAMASGVDVQGQTTSSEPSHNTTLSDSVPLVIEVPSTVTNLDMTDSSLNDVWLAVDTDGTGPASQVGDVYVRHGTGLSAPGHPSVKVGRTNPDDASQDTRANDNSSPTFKDVTAEDLVQIRFPGQGNLSTVQDAVNDIENDDGMVLIPSQTWNETVTLDENIRFEGQGIGTKLEGSGGHTLEVTRQDAIIRDLWIDQVDTGTNFDAVNIGAREVRAINIDVDAADRYACHVDARDTFLRGWRIIGADEAGIKMTANANHSIVSDILIRDSQNSISDKGLVVDSGCAFCQFNDIEVHEVPGNGIESNGGDWNSYRALVKNAGDRGVVMSGSKKNLYLLQVSGSTNEDIDCQGDNKVIFAQVGGEVKISGNDNWFWGSYGSLTESGVRNVVNGTVVSPETLSLGGTDGTVTPTDLGVPVLPFYVDAGGSATNLTGVDGVARDGQKIRIIHRGGEDVVLEDDSGATNQFKNKSGSNDTLSNNGNMAEYVFDSDRGGVWYQTTINQQL